MTEVDGKQQRGEMERRKEKATDGKHRERERKPEGGREGRREGNDKGRGREVGMCREI